MPYSSSIKIRNHPQKNELEIINVYGRETMTRRNGQTYSYSLSNFSIHCSTKYVYSTTKKTHLDVSVDTGKILMIRILKLL
jgi:hypothetical protein